MTAEYLLRRLYQVKPGDRILVHAAAGGMGQILSAWGRALGAEVIGTVGSEAKMAVARDAGCHRYALSDIRQAHAELEGRATAGAIVPVP